jgi:hypothetical protein
VVGFAEFTCRATDENDAGGLFFFVGGRAKSSQVGFAEKKWSREIDVEGIALCERLA